MDDFKEFARSLGLIIEDVIISGSIQRVPIEDGKRGNKDGAYCLYNNTSGIAGWVQNFRTGEYSTYSKNSNTSEQEIIQKQNELQKKLTISHEDTAQKCAYLVNNIFAKAVNHPYLMKKQIKPHEALIDKYGALIIPLRNINGIIRTFQRITDDGFKTYLKGGEQKGNYFQFGDIKTKVVICEGFATGASIFESTHIPTVSAMNSGNLLAVAVGIRNKYGNNLNIIIAADNDAFVENNPGIRYAKEAAKACNGTAVIPEFIQKDKKWSDFNDLMVSEGITAVKKQILSRNN